MRSKEGDTDNKGNPAILLKKIDTTLSYTEILNAKRDRISQKVHSLHVIISISTENT